jgi:hypothetical protein
VHRESRGRRASDKDHDDVAVGPGLLGTLPNPAGRVQGQRVSVDGGEFSFASCRTIRLIRLQGRLTALIPIMKHRIASLASLSRASLHTPQHQCRRYGFGQHNAALARPFQVRSFAIASKLRAEAPKFNEYNNSNARPASELNNNITQEEKDHFAKKLQEDKGKQIRTPWHREGSDVPPVARQRSAGAMTKGLSCAEPS